MTKDTQSLRFHVGKRKDATFAKSVSFHLPPDAFARIQLPTIAGQQKHWQFSLVTSDFRRDLFVFVGRMTIPYQKKRPQASDHQRIQKSAHHFPIHCAFFNHQIHSPLPIHHTEHVQMVPRARTRHNGGLSFETRSCPRVIIAPHTRFVCKPDLRSPSLPFFYNRRISLLNPLPYPLRVLLASSPQGFLGSHTQLCQQALHRIDAQPDIIPWINQRRDGVARPQGKRKLVLVLRWILASDRLINPSDDTPIHLARATSAFASVQAIPSTSMIHRQRVVDAGAAKPHSTDNDFGAFSALYPWPLVFEVPSILHASVSGGLSFCFPSPVFYMNC